MGENPRDCTQEEEGPLWGQFQSDRCVHASAPKDGRCAGWRSRKHGGRADLSKALHTEHCEVSPPLDTEEKNVLALWAVR